MSVIVDDTGFHPAPALPGVALMDIAGHLGTLDLAQTDNPAALIPYLDDLTLIRVAFPAFNDGRAFTVARRLRVLGYKAYESLGRAGSGDIYTPPRPAPR